jgi:hypothetical protein
VETGLDAFYSHLFPHLRRRRMVPVFDGDSIRFLVEAYRKTYSLNLDPSLFLTSHRASVRMSVQGLLTIGALSKTVFTDRRRNRFGGWGRIIRGVLALARGVLRRDSLLKALLSPHPPTPWLLETVGQRVESFSDHFLHHFRTGLAELLNHNLDTGEVQETSSTPLATTEALRFIAREGGWMPQELRSPPLPPKQPHPIRLGAYG